MSVGNEVHASMEVYTNAHISQPLQSKSSNQHVTYFGLPEVRFGQVGEASSDAGAEVVAAVVVVAAAAVPDAAGGPAAVVVAAAELLTAAAGISTAAAAE